MWWMVVVRWVRWIWFPTVLVLYGLLIYSTVCGQRGLLPLLRLTQEQREWETQVRTLLRDNADLKDRIQRLHTDDEFLEKVVREGLGLVRQNELVYRFRDPAKSS